MDGGEREKIWVRGAAGVTEGSREKGIRGEMRKRGMRIQNPARKVMKRTKKAEL